VASFTIASSPVTIPPARYHDATIRSTGPGAVMRIALPPAMPGSSATRTQMSFSRSAPVPKAASFFPSRWLAKTATVMSNAVPSASM